MHSNFLIAFKLGLLNLSRVIHSILLFFFINFNWRIFRFIHSFCAEFLNEILLFLGVMYRPLASFSEFLCFSVRIQTFGRGVHRYDSHYSIHNFIKLFSNDDSIFFFNWTIAIVPWSDTIAATPSCTRSLDRSLIVITSNFYWVMNLPSAEYSISNAH